MMKPNLKEIRQRDEIEWLRLLACLPLDNDLQGPVDRHILLAYITDLERKLTVARELLKLVKPVIAKKPTSPKTMVELTAYVSEDQMPQIESIPAVLKELGE